MTNRLVDLIEEEIDLSMPRVSERPLDGALVARKLATSRQVARASPPVCAGTGPRTPRDLLAHKCLLYGTAVRHEGWEFRRNDSRNG